VPGEAIKGHLDLLLLTLIDSGARHGYALAERLRTASDGTFDLADGTIYPALRRLSDSDLVTSRWSDDGGRRRRVYSLTAKGRRALRKERAQWEQFERSMQAVLKLRPS
jgi:PadR family transcriptional regulator